MNLPPLKSRTTTCSLYALGLGLGGVAFAACTALGQVGDTGLRLLLVVEETPMLAPVRWRFFWQMLLVLVGQAVTILLFSWFLRRTYLRYREMDEVLAQQEKLAALDR